VSSGYQVHVLVRGQRSGLSEWHAMRPSGCSTPYVFTTRADAEAAMRLCYGSVEHSAHVRIVEV
jgi:hypothetical protein